MLFEKIRRTQKPVFIVLALMFGMGFVFLGVGSGTGGISLGNLIGNGGGSSSSISDLLDKVHHNPKDATSWQQLGDAYPELPDGLSDRQGDAWEPLLAIADAAGGDWPAHARAAAVALHSAPHQRAGGNPAEKAYRNESCAALSAHDIALLAVNAWAMVTPSAYSRSPPTGRPRAMRVIVTACFASLR